MKCVSVNRGNTADERRAQILADPAAPATNPCGTGAYLPEHPVRRARLLALPSGDDGFTVTPSAGPDGAGLGARGTF